MLDPHKKINTPQWTTASILLLLASLVFSSDCKAENNKNTFKFEGTPGTSFFGICTSTDSPQEKRIEGVTPSEISMDIHFSKCTIGKRTKKGKLALRVFQGRKEIMQPKDIPATSGIEIVIPLSFKK